MYLESLKIVIPMGMMMLAGYSLKRANMTNAPGEKMLNNIVHWLLLPCLIFYNIATCQDLSSIDSNFFVLETVVITVSILAVALIVYKRPRETRVAILTCLCRTNMSVYGSTMALSMLAGAEAKLALLYLSYGVAIQNMFLIGALEVMEASKLRPIRIAFQIIKSPLVAAAISALLLNLLGLTLPEIIRAPLSSLAQCTTPMAFLMLGIGFRLTKDRSENLNIFAVIFARLILMPALIFLPTLGLFKLQGAEFVALASILATPCGVSNVSLALQFGGNGVVTNESIVWTSVLSIATFPLFIYMGNLVIGL